MHREDYYLGIRAILTNFPDRLKPIQTRHADIEDCHIGFQFLGLVYRFPPVRCLAGKKVEAISVIVRGRVRVTRDDHVFGELVTGNIVGSALLLSGVTPEVDAVVVEPVRCMQWEVEPLDRYLAANLETRIILQRYLARDLAGKMLAVVNP